MIKRITAICMAATIAVSAVPVFAKPIYKKGDNIASKAKISASVMGGDATSTPHCLNDGEVPSLANGSTKWFVVSGTDGAWAEFTFPEPVNIKDAKVHGGMQNAAEKDIIAGFKIQYYTPSGWKDAAEVSENADFTIPVSFDGVVTSDRFRLLSTSKVRFRLTEVELYEAIESEAASEGGDVKTIEDVDGKYKIPVETVLNIGLLDGEYVLNDEDMIKRGEFVKLLMDFIGETLPENMPDSIFYDVKSGTDIAKSIARATEPSALLGITDRLIRYRLSNGEISAVQMQESEPEKEPLYLKDTAGEFVRYKNANGYYGTNNVLSANGNGRNLILTSDTIIFKTLVNRTGDEKKDYVVLRGGGIFNGKYSSKSAEVYNINTDGIPEAIHFNEEKSAQQLSLSSAVGVVKKVSKIYDTVEEELKTHITFLYNGNELELIMDEDAVYNGAYNTFGAGFAGGAVYSAMTPDQIKKGDVIQFSVENGKIVTYRIIAVASESDITGILQQTGGDRPGVMPLIESAYGHIASYSDTTISVDVNGTIYTYLNASPNIYIYYKDGVTVEKADSSYIVSKLNDGVGSRVFVRVSSKAVRDIIIYK